MIHRVSCDRTHFKEISFRPGLNVVLADRTKGSTRKDSRNGLGKSTLIEIMHFCLGANKDETLKKPELDGWAFTLHIDLEHVPLSVTRNTTKSGITVCKENSVIGEHYSTAKWKEKLGESIFGLQPSHGDLKYIPKFRSLISYFIRRNGQRGGFLDPFENHKKQYEWDKQLHNAFLLGFGWEYASRWQVLKDRGKVLGHLKQEAQSAMMIDGIGTLGEVEASIIRLEAQISNEEAQLRSFQVHPQYAEIEQAANELTDRIHELANSNVVDRRLLDRYQDSIEQEADAKPESVARVYKEAGVAFSDALKRRLDQVLEFHKQVVINRQSFVASEMERLKESVSGRAEQQHILSDERAELMNILQTHGALDEYTQIQRQHQKTISKLEDLKRRAAELQRYEDGSNALDDDQRSLQREARSDSNERKAAREKAVLLFNDNSEALYEAPGTLSLDVTKTGFKFNVNIKRSGSIGVGNMKIFCYDLMLAQLWAEKEHSPGLLIHDSNLFDGVDERQIALALQLAARESEKYGFQYICTMNSDAVPRDDFDKDFHFDDYVVKTLTDATEDGGLLGIRF